ncbi:MAG: toprim domain-containing protein, partial [Proteobacteria bacterium]|nr:toprim domain-containing protein [Pseudomonadota bacterium]
KGRELYGLYEAKQARNDFRRVIVVEGYMDVVRLHQAGITYALATLGTATTQEHLNRIFRLTSEVVFCFDGDRAGRQAAWRALENALPLARDGRELRFLFLPEGEDPDSLVGKEGQQAFEARMDRAMPLSEYLVAQLVQQTDLSHADGRARLAALARPLFGRMPDGVLRELIADALAEQIRMPADRLRHLLQDANTPSTAAGARPPRGPGTSGPSPSPRPDSRMKSGRRNMLSQAIGLVLHFPTAARSIDTASIVRIDHPGIPVLRELIEQARQVQAPSTATLLERWRDRPELPRLEAIAAETPMVSDSQAAARELEMAVRKLAQDLGPGRRTDELLKKARETGLNSDEKTELGLLLKGRTRQGPDA